MWSHRWMAVGQMTKQAIIDDGICSDILHIDIRAPVIPWPNINV
jgi:hypothetical protein